ncbi:MAG: hypothetical protein U0T69_11470 [Chitinophagales bacterium]
MSEEEVQTNNNEAANASAAATNADIKFSIGASQQAATNTNTEVVNTETVNTEQNNTNTQTQTEATTAATTEATANNEAAEKATTEQKKIPIEFKKQEPSEIFNTLKQQYGREIDEDYLKKDYKSLFTQAEEKLKHFESKIAILDDEVIKSIVDYKNKGGDLKEFFYAQTIDADSIPQDKLITDFVNRQNPDYDDLIKEMELTQKYGIGIDLEAEIKEARENQDTAQLYKLAEIKKNRIDASNAQKQYINAQKVEILNRQPAVQNQEEVQKQFEAKLGEYAKYAEENLSTIRELTLGDFSLGEQIADTSYIGYKDESGILYVHGITDRELTEAIFIYKNKDAIFNKIREDLNVDAEIKNDQAFNNPVQTNVIPTSSSSNGEIKFQIKGK